MLRVFVVDLRYWSPLLSCSFEVVGGVVNGETFIYCRTSNYKTLPNVCIINHEGFVDMLMKIID